MTEREWLGCTRPKPMLEFLEGKVSDRKLRLFACACCRSIWHLLREQCLRDAVEAAEKFADGRMAVESLTEISEVAWDTKYRLEETETDDEDDEAVFCAASAAASASCGPGNSETPYIFRAMDVSSFTCDAGGLKREDQAHLLCDMMGNPFRLLPPKRGKRHWKEMVRRWLTWNEATVPNLARSIYQKRAFNRMPILADALEEAGCDHAEILAHCREPWPHVRGCWVVDAVLGKA